MAKEWYLSLVVAPTKDNTPDKSSTLAMKTLYFLKRDNPDLNCGFILGQDEMVRESFENAGLPQHVYVKNGKTYYIANDELSVSHFERFVSNYTHYAVTAY